MSDYNISNAILILGAIYLHLVHGLDGLVAALLCAFAIVTWTIWGFTEERRQLLKAYADYYCAKAEYYKLKVSSYKS